MARRVWLSTSMIPTEGLRLGPYHSLHGCGAIMEFLSATVTGLLLLLPLLLYLYILLLHRQQHLRHVYSSAEATRSQPQPADDGLALASVMRSRSVPMKVKVCVYALHVVAATQQQQLAMYVWTEYCKVCIYWICRGWPWNAANLSADRQRLQLAT
jgi:hypothetical protein